MAEHVFYAVENHHNERQIKILSVGSLVSKPPTKEKRISIKAKMPLSGTVNMGSPEWLDSAYAYVASHGGDTITPDIEFKGYSIDFSVENLFGENVLAQKLPQFCGERYPERHVEYNVRGFFVPTLCNLESSHRAVGA